MSQPSTVTAPPFGTVTAPMMVISELTDGHFGELRTVPLAPLELHPFAHVLHYASSCFEGLKAHRGTDGVVRIFRADRHAQRMVSSAAKMSLPVPDVALVRAAIDETVRANLDAVPDLPGALYVRPILFGTDPNIGAAASPPRSGLLYVVASPVGDYFAGGLRPLRLLVETEQLRTTPQFGEIKTGANYAAALGTTLQAKAEHGADQVLFAPGGVVQETGAANFLLLDGARIVTPALNSTFLHGVTRDALLTIGRDLGYQVEERSLSVDELRAWTEHGEAALSGTAAVLTGVGTLIIGGTEVTVGDGEVGPSTRRLRQALLDIQRGEAPDVHGWTSIAG